MFAATQDQQLPHFWGLSGVHSVKDKHLH